MSTAVLDTPVTLPAPDRAPGFGAAVRSELVKLATVRSTRFVALAVVLSALAGAFLEAFSMVASYEPGLDRPPAEATAAVLETARLAAQLMTAVLAILVVTSEFATGSIRSTLTSVPRRGRLLAAKGTVVVVVVAGLSVLSLAASYLATLPLDAHVGLDAGPTAPAVLRAVGAFVIFNLLVGVFALAVGTLVRHTAGAIVLVLGVLVVLPTPLAWLSGGTGVELSHYSFGSAASSVAYLGVGTSSSLGTAVPVLLAWLVVPAALGVLGFVRRDV